MAYYATTSTTTVPPHQDAGIRSDWVHKGHVLDTHKQYIQFRFRVILFLIFMFEVFASAWPITASVLWGVQSLITWFWYIYIIRVFLLVYPFIFYENILNLYGTGNYHDFFNWARIPAAFVPSTTLFLWAWAALLIGGLFGGMISVATAAAYPLFKSKSLYGLSVGFTFLFTIESICAVFLLYWKGIWVPIVNSRNNVMRGTQTV